MVRGKQDPRVSREYKKIRLIVLARDGYVCYYCGQDANTVDHIIAISNGGNPVDPSNLISACRRCNSSKGSRSQGVFLARDSTPPAYPIHTSPITSGTVPAGPCVGQTEQD
jgi:5-methylcytosine-specific restriction endonuclease McrA